MWSTKLNYLRSVLSLFLRVSCSLDWSQTNSLAVGDLELLVLLPHLQSTLIIGMCYYTSYRMLGIEQEKVKQWQMR